MIETFPLNSHWGYENSTVAFVDNHTAVVVTDIQYPPIKLELRMLRFVNDEIIRCIVDAPNQFVFEWEAGISSACIILS